MPYRHYAIIIVLLLFLSQLGGCRCSQEEPPPSDTASPAATRAPEVSTPAESPTIAEGSINLVPPALPVPLLIEPLEPKSFELPAQALAEWRRHRGRALVVFSQDPFLQPIPEEIFEDARRLIRNGDDEEILARFGRPGPAPLLQPQMALRAALEFGLFSKVIWVLPTDLAAKKIDLKQFQLQLTEFGGLSEAEAATFESAETGLFYGTVAQVPIHVVHAKSLPSLEEPVLLHLDLSYFAPLYKGEIKTPLYRLVGSHLARLRDAGWMASGVTISLSHRNGKLPLETRFLGPDVAKIFAEPERTDQPIPRLWELRSQALYLENFMSTDDIYSVYQEALALAPDDPAVHFALYNIQRQLKKGDEALESLARAVALDPVYGMEYLKLVPTALEKGRPDKAFQMLDLAAAAFPDDPFIPLEKVQLLIDMDHASEGRPMIERLLQLGWSKVYYPAMETNLRNLLKQFSEQKKESPDAP